MITIEEAIDIAVKKLTAPRVVVVRATDEQVAAKITELASLGYIPSEQIVEPVRAFLEGYALLLTGEAGVGKTFLMKCLGVRIRHVDEIVDYGLSRIRDWYDWTDETDLCIDDLGTDRISTEYGAKDDVLKAVIAHRECGQRKDRPPNWIGGHRNGLTHVTTNLTAVEIKDRYGDRTLSRLLGMCKPFTLAGDSMRSPKPSGG